jgi:hypothetical protein
MHKKRKRPVAQAANQGFRRIGAQLVCRRRIKQPGKRQQADDEEHRLGGAVHQQFFHGAATVQKFFFKSMPA